MSRRNVSNARTKRGEPPLGNSAWTPLHCAGGNSEVVKVLVESCTKVNVEDSSGRTAFDHANDSGHTGVARYLKEHRGKTGHPRPLIPAPH